MSNIKCQKNTIKRRYNLIPATIDDECKRIEL